MSKPTGKIFAQVELRRRSDVFPICRPKGDPCAEAKSMYGSPSLWDRILNILRVEEPATITNLRRWLPDIAFGDLYWALEEMRLARAITMEVVGELHTLEALYWYGVREEDSQ